MSAEKNGKAAEAKARAAESTGVRKAVAAGSANVWRAVTAAGNVSGKKSVRQKPVTLEWMEVKREYRFPFLKRRKRNRAGENENRNGI